MCGPFSLPASERGACVWTVAVEMRSWDTHKIVTRMAEIILREKLGYPAEKVCRPTHIHLLTHTSSHKTTPLSACLDTPLCASACLRRRRCSWKCLRVDNTFTIDWPYLSRRCAALPSQQAAHIACKAPWS